MNCIDDLHQSLIESGDIVCPFCDSQLTYVKQKPQRYDCCIIPDIINDNSKIVCRKCGVVQRIELAEEYIDFHSNKHKMKRKSVYQRKYYLNGVILNICERYNIEYHFIKRTRLIGYL